MMDEIAESFRVFLGDVPWLLDVHTDGDGLRPPTTMTVVVTDHDALRARLMERLMPPEGGITAADVDRLRYCGLPMRVEVRP